LDLIEHEMGHALGWPHSRWRTEYDSAVDVMSDSAAGRRHDDLRRHGPGVLAINRYLSGWTTFDPVFVDAGLASTVSIESERFAIVSVGSNRVVTLEVVDSVGDFSHLLGPGVVVHLVDWGPDVCAQPSTVPGDPRQFCLGSARSHRLVAPSGSLDGVMRPGSHVDIAGVRVVLDTLDSRVGSDGLSTFAAVIELTPTQAGS